MSKINSLTPEQIAKFPEYVEKWKRTGLSTEPIDFDRAKEACRLSYRMAGLKEPSFFIRLKSPVEGAIGACLLNKLAQVGAQVRAQVGAQVEDQVGAQVRAQVGAQVRAQVGAQVGAQVRAQVGAQVGAQVRAQVEAQVGAQVRDQVRAQVRAQVGAQVRAQVGAQVEDQVGAQVRAQVGAQVGAQVEAQVGAQVRAQVRDQVRDQVWKACFGSLDASWISYYDYMLRELGLECCKKLEGIYESTEIGWWWAFENAVIITDRPTELHFDSLKRLHNANGPSILYPDGFSVCAWHGRRVDKSVICDPVTVEKISQETNAEIRRILIERYGQTKYVKDSGSVRVHSDDFGTLYRKDEPGDDPIYAVNVICPTTGREYFLGVDPEAYGWKAGKNARAAVASTWRRSDGSLAFARPSDYAPEVET